MEDLGGRGRTLDSGLQAVHAVSDNSIGTFLSNLSTLSIVYICSHTKFELHLLRILGLLSNSASVIFIMEYHVEAISDNE